MTKPRRNRSSRPALVILCAALTLLDPASASMAALPPDPCTLQPQYLIFFGETVADPASQSPQQSKLRDRAKLLIDSIAAGWHGGSSPLLIVGHIDEAELRSMPDLDQKRADAVRDALIERGVDPRAIWTRGDAFRTPMVPVAGSEIQNRYVSVTAPAAQANCPNPVIP